VYRLNKIEKCNFLISETSHIYGQIQLKKIWHQITAYVIKGIKSMVAKTTQFGIPCGTHALWPGTAYVMIM
jgi:hypothetical protein